jgi:hypothetical protein
MTDRDQRFSENSNQEEQEQPVQSPVLEPAAESATPQQQQIPKEKMFTRMHNKLGRLHLFAAFCENPANVSFETQEPDEHVLLFLRKSQWVNFPWIATAMILLALPIVAYLLRASYATFIPSFNVIAVAIPFYYLLVAIYAFLNFITWYYNAALITDKRIIDVDFHQLVFKDVAETKLALVQDVSYNQIGVFQNMFGFGFVLIQTAGTLDNFEFYALPQPARVVEVVEGLIGGRRYYEP